MVDSYEDHGILSWFDIAENYLRLIGIKTVLQVFEQLLRDKSKDVTQATAAIFQIAQVEMKKKKLRFFETKMLA